MGVNVLMLNRYIYVMNMHLIVGYCTFQDTQVKISCKNKVICRTNRTVKLKTVFRPVQIIFYHMLIIVKILVDMKV